MPRNITTYRSTCSLGQGCKFRALERDLSRKGVRDPKALAAWIGRRKYGSARFQALAAHGRREH